MLIKYSIQLWIFLLRSPDFGIVAGLAILVLLCASLPYMSIGTEVLIRQVISPKIKEAETLDKSRLSALFAGVPDRNRTCDVSLRRRTLYPTEVLRQEL